MMAINFNHFLRSGLVAESPDDWTIQHIEPYVMVSLMEE
jgi:hypothetical protein